MKTQTHDRGFALVVSLTMLVLLTVIAVGLLSLSAITLRTATQSSAQAEAQANARLALMIAIGELQKQMGPDQRVSANGSITAASGVAHPHITGVWDSWIAGPADQSSVNPRYPSAESHHQTLGSQPDHSMRPEYNRKDLHFRTWLLSLNENEATDPNTPFTLSLNAEKLPAGNTEAVYLVREGSLGKSALTTDYVSARLTRVDPAKSQNQHRGRYAWWVGDESQKARIMHDSYQDETLVAADRIFRGQSPASTGTTTIPGLASLDAAQQARLKGLPTLNTLDLVPGVEQITEGGTFRASQKGFYSVTPYSSSVLADVREGGLKRDLSTLLERPISRTETGDEFMLYKFDVKDAWANNPSYGLPNTPQECVPIQDLAAYYQLYDQSRKGGIEYNSGGIKTTSPNYGNATLSGPWNVTHDYSGMYRQPVPVKVQFVLSLHAEPITAADRAITTTSGGVTYLANLSIPETDTHKLRLAVIPVVTMWNPYNVPLTMQSGASCQSFRIRSPSFFISCVKTRSSGEKFTASNLNMTFAAVGSSVTGGNAEGRADLMRLNFGYTGPAVTFKPGEVRVFSMPSSSSNTIYANGGNDYNRGNITVNNLEATPGWNSTGYYTFQNSTPNAGSRTRTTPNPNLAVGECNVVWDYVPGTTIMRYSISLAEEDSLAFSINAEPATGTSNVVNISRTVAPAGSAITHYMIQRNIGINSYSYINLFNNSFVTRFGRDTTPTGPFVNALMRQGIVGGANSYPVEDIQARQIINASGGATVPFMQFALMAGCEVSESIGEFGGRKYPMRPFLHSSVIAPTLIDKSDATAPYLHGWNWWMEDIGSILSALVNNTQDGEGYFGGGYTPEGGVTKVIQQEIPVTPPISIAALSHARLGGFTLANEAPVGEGRTGAGQMEGYGGGLNPLSNHLFNPSITLGFQRVTASGQGGLYPHTLQAIGNSYAHPMLPPGKAFNPDYERIMDADDGPRKVVFADHSYLANKALWDDYFFSSITPQAAGTIEVFGSTSRDAKQVASDFFFNGKPLPNRRIVPYTSNMSASMLDTLFAAKDTFTNGLADKIASHLMIEGAFNINSTSVDAWRVFFSSLKGKPVAYLDGGKAPKESPTTGTPVSGLTLPVGISQSGTINDSKSPAEQWLGLRELTDEEVEQLAQAMVKQVRIRGPFLSLSEFVNRRIETTTADMDPPDNLAVMGALQAALDDPDVDINRSFREDSLRNLDDETSSLTFAFKAAAKGPVAYGSAAYIDQADILRHLGSQMTPRGDTFVIRTYGDSLAADGKVLARAWCEAVVQRVPNYIDPTNQPHEKQSALSDSNKIFGRQFEIIHFRWMHRDEI
jgi:hypothetical protein